MIDQCENPQCAKPLHYLREGRIFIFDTGRTDIRCEESTHRIEHYWLCGCCAQFFTLERTLNGPVLVPRDGGAQREPEPSLHENLSTLVPEDRFAQSSTGKTVSNYLVITGDSVADRGFVPLPAYKEYSIEEMKHRAAGFYSEIQHRRTVREFSDKDVPLEIIEDCLRAAGTAPNGANMQPWHFVVVSDQTVKRKIRVAAEKEEHEFYHHKAPQEWLDALAPLGTDERKPFLQTAPYLIVIFAQSYGVLPDGRKVKHYYAQESVGIATGILITAIHHAGLVSLTHTPSPMGFLNELLGRPAQERPFLILVVGYPTKDATVPAITKRSLDEIATFI